MCCTFFLGLFCLGVCKTLMTVRPPWMGVIMSNWWIGVFSHFNPLWRTSLFWCALWHTDCKNWPFFMCLKVLIEVFLMQLSTHGWRNRQTHVCTIIWSGANNIISWCERFCLIHVFFFSKNHIPKIRHGNVLENFRWSLMVGLFLIHIMESNKQIFLWLFLFNPKMVGGFKYFWFSPLFGENSNFD